MLFYLEDYSFELYKNSDEAKRHKHCSHNHHHTHNALTHSNQLTHSHGPKAGQEPTELPQKDIACHHCLTMICSRCKKPPHEPLSCQLDQIWDKIDTLHKKSKPAAGNNNELEEMLMKRKTQNWINKNSKKCPKCGVNIEKNQGCLHMTCRQCKYHFCWECLLSWSEHKRKNGTYYKCAVAERKKKKNKKASSNTKKTNNQSDLAFRFVTYKTKYDNHYPFYEYNVKRLQKVHRMLDPKQGSEFAYYNIHVEPGIFDAYLKLMVQLVLFQTFVLNTFRLGYFLKDPGYQKLLGENRGHLLASLGLLDELFEEGPLESFVRFVDGGGIVKTRNFDEFMVRLGQQAEKVKGVFQAARKQWDPRLLNIGVKEFEAVKFE